MGKIAKKTVLCGAGFVPCRVQGRQKHAGEDGDDRNRYCLSERSGRGYLLLSKNTTCGLYDSWNGSGSILEIKLEKDVRLPFRCIASADHDGCHGYAIREIYGCSSDLWCDNAVKLASRR